MEKLNVGVYRMLADNKEHCPAQSSEEGECEHDVMVSSLKMLPESPQG